MEEKMIEELRQSNSQRKIHGSFRYAMNKTHKANERIRTMKFQKIADSYKKIQQKKLGTHKIKGEVMKTSTCLNSRCAKGWATLSGFKESYKSYCIWDIT